MVPDTPDDALAASPPSSASVSTSRTEAVEREMRDAEQAALAESGLGSGLLARQPLPNETVAVLKVCPQCGREYETTARFCPADGTALRPKDSDSLVGRVLADRYHILKRIGEGGMGRVYLGEHVKMNRQCAIKVMSPALVNDNESAARFAREASNAARIIHPNVAAVFDYGESEGLIYLVMEYVDGEPLSRILAREAPLAVERALELARQIADGLGAAHELGIIHRDLKPDNILVSRSRAGREVPKVVDFGIAKAVQDNSNDALTRTGLVIGTPEFMSPEQLLGDPIDARSDLYALGCILHLMLTASPPFAASTREQMIKRRLTEDAPHVQKLDAGLPDSVDRIVARLLARSPADRYGSAAEVRDALAGTHARRANVDSGARAALPTPRSAPTQRFVSAALAPTEVTELAIVPVLSRPRPRAASIMLGVILVVGGALVVRGARSGGDALVPPSQFDEPAGSSTPPLTAGTPGPPAPRLITVPPVVVARAETPRARAVVKVVDSAAIRARADRQRQQDSLARLAQAVPQPVRAAINRYVQAIESRRVDKLREAYPNLTDQQQKFWENSVFGIATAINASVSYGKMSETDDKAEVDFTLRVAYTYRGNTRGNIPPQQLHATLVRTAKDGWQIADIHDIR
jgi:eukaryotic-like serine/threonine-protein kinase